MQPRLEIRGLHAGYHLEDGSYTPAVAGVDISVNSNEFVSIIGPSGCGKSTLFNVVAGLIAPQSGEVLLNGTDIVGQPGNVAYMMQRDLLLPWRTVIENVVLAPELAGSKTSETYDRASALLNRFGLKGYENAYPSALSGGMKQRAALLRTIMGRRSVILLDEPFGALDALTRASMHEWLLGVQREFQLTMVLITHDPDEAIYLSDRVYISSPRPMHIAGVETINLPDERRSDISTSPEFGEHKRNVLARLIEKKMVEVAQ